MKTEKTDFADINEKFERAVGWLTVLSANLRDGRSDPAADADVVDNAMLLLAGMQQVAAWEPTHTGGMSPSKMANQLRAMASIGPRPPAVIRLLLDSAGYIDTAYSAKAEAAEDLSHAAAAELVRIRLASDALFLAQRLAGITGKRS